MSFDLMVFDPEVAPRERAEFMAWFSDLSKWEKQRDYNSPNGITGNLPIFYEKIRQEFPNMNDLYAQELNKTSSNPKGFWQKLFGTKQPLDTEPVEYLYEQPIATGYTFDDNAIYMDFRWDVSSTAYNRVFNIALSTGVGFFDVSSNDGDILHDGEHFYDVMGL